MKINRQNGPNGPDIKGELQSALSIFLAEMYPNNQSIMCSIHDSFRLEDNTHNCIACNFTDYTDLLRTALQYSQHACEPLDAFAGIILYAYLLIERFDEVFKIIKLPEEYRLKHFQIFNKIRRWANFIKHPKAFMLVHHPTYYFDCEITLEAGDENYNILIDQRFIDEFYAGGKENNKLYNILSNKTNVVVLIPNLPKLILEFCTAQKKFIQIISTNEVFREILDEKSTFKNYFENNFDESL